MTGTAVARGAQWSAAMLYDGWGDNCPDGCDTELGNLVVTRFEELVEQHGGNASWFPRTAEVIAEVYGENTDEHSMWEETDPLPDSVTYDDLREQATKEVWEACCGYDTPMSPRVNAILDRYEWS